MPKAILDAAAEHELPLFEVPYEMPFIAITERASALLVNEQFGVLERGVQVHERLERLVIEGGGSRPCSAPTGERDRRRPRSCWTAPGASWPASASKRRLPDAAALKALGRGARERVGPTAPVTAFAPEQAVAGGPRARGPGPRPPRRRAGRLARS